MLVDNWLNSRKSIRPLTRVRQEINYNTQALASATNVSVPTIRDAEWGLYSDFPPKLTTFLEQEFDYDPKQLNKVLHEYQLETRLEFGEEFLDLLPRPGPNYAKSLSKSLDVTLNSVAKCLCVQRADLYRLDQTPPQLSQAVSQALLLVVGSQNPSLGIQYVSELRKTLDTQVNS